MLLRKDDKRKLNFVGFYNFFFLIFCLQVARDPPEKVCLNVKQIPLTT